MSVHAITVLGEHLTIQFVPAVHILCRNERKYSSEKLLTSQDKSSVVPAEMFVENERSGEKLEIGTLRFLC